jgi:hypothetical protein
VLLSYFHEDAAADCVVGISARWGEKHHSLMILHAIYLDAPPEPKGMYPRDSCAVRTLQISSSDPLAGEAFDRPMDGPP